MSPQLRELMERYLAGDMEPLEAEAFLILIGDDAEALAELQQALLQQARLFEHFRSTKTASGSGMHGAVPAQSDLRLLQERYLAGDLSPIEAEAFLILIRDDPTALAALKQALLQQALLHDLLRAPAVEVRSEVRRPTPSRLTPVASGRRSAVRIAPVPPSESPIRALPRRVRWLAAACVVALTGGLLWLGIATFSLPGTRVATYEEEETERRQEVLQRLQEIERQVEATFAQQGATAAPAAKAAESVIEEPPPPTTVLDAIEKAERKAEEEELARLLEARRRALVAELAGLNRRRPDARAGDEEEGVAVAPKAPVVPKAAGTDVAVQAVAPGEVGRVVFVEAQAPQGVVVRGGEERQKLETGLVLRHGDRIETARGAEQTCAALELEGGATVDLAGSTAVQILGRDSMRLENGLVYATVAPKGDAKDEYGAPFSLQTPAARYLTTQVRMEVFASPLLTQPAQTRARVDSGKVHLVNARGHVLGRSGQEVAARTTVAPLRAGEFTGPIWRGRDADYPGLPFARGNPVICTNDNPTRWFGEEYALALSHAGILNLRGLQVAHGQDQRTCWQKLQREAATLGQAGLRNLPEIVLGASGPLQRPASGRFEETRPVDSPAVRQLLGEARKARPERPVLVTCAGPLTDIASAWLMDRRCAETVVVVKDLGGTTDIDWTWDPWAGELVLSQFRCVILPGGVSLTVDPARLTRAPDPRWRFLAKRTENTDPDFDAIALATVPGFIQETQRTAFVLKPDGSFEYRPEPAGRIWLVQRVDATLLEQEFYRTFLGSDVRP
jgi:hypothetical protein